jgi:DNA-binding transcriptional ArsR family regulator
MGVRPVAPLDPGRAGGPAVREIARQVGISVPATNRHLDVLRDSGLIAGHPQGQEILHVLTPLGAALLTRRAPE